MSFFRQFFVQFLLVLLFVGGFGIYLVEPVEANILPGGFVYHCLYDNNGTSFCDEFTDLDKEDAQKKCVDYCSGKTEYTCIRPSTLAEGICPPNVFKVNSVYLKNPLTGTTNPGSITDIISKVINGVLGVIGAITLLVFVYGGFEWLTSGGNEDKVKKGTEAMVWAMIGLFIVFGSYAILNTILSGFFKGGQFG